MKKIAARLFLAGMLILLGGNLAQAQGVPDHPGPSIRPQSQLPLERALGLPGQQGRWWTNPRLVEYLKLTEEEQKAMNGILLQHRERLIDLRAGLQKADLKLEELVGEEKPEETAILAQIDRVAQARAELEKANARYLLAIWSKMTPEQRTLIRQYRANNHPGPWGGYRPGQETGQHPQGAETH